MENASSNYWNQKYTYSDKERWLCIYPTYINARKTVAEGRRISKAKAVDNPTSSEIRDVLISLGFQVIIENKFYPREQDRNMKGRLRVQLKNEDGSQVNPIIHNKNVLMENICEMIPKLKTRSQASSSTAPSSASVAIPTKKKNKKNK